MEKVRSNFALISVYFPGILWINFESIFILQKMYISQKKCVLTENRIIPQKINKGWKYSLVV